MKKITSSNDKSSKKPNGKEPTLRSSPSKEALSKKRKPNKYIPRALLPNHELLRIREKDALQKRQYRKRLAKSENADELRAKDAERKRIRRAELQLEKDCPPLTLEKVIELRWEKAKQKHLGGSGKGNDTKRALRSNSTAEKCY